jgi:CheY-like chemotaxis protein
MDLLNHHRLDISLAIIDVFMPLVSGFELIRRLTEDKAELKIIAISEGRQKVLDAAILLGADAGVKKPPPGAPTEAAQWLNEVFLQIGLP